jgi:hypothetical protein
MTSRGSFLILVAVVVLAASRGGADEPVTACRGTFEATMHRESGTGLALGGEYVMTVEGSGTVAGALTLEDGDIVPLVGQAQGRAMSLAFDLGDEREVFGVGAAAARGVRGRVRRAVYGPGERGPWRLARLQVGRAEIAGVEAKVQAGSNFATL